MVATILTVTQIIFNYLITNRITNYLIRTKRAGSRKKKKKKKKKKEKGSYEKKNRICFRSSIPYRYSIGDKGDNIVILTVAQNLRLRLGETTMMTVFPNVTTGNDRG